MPLFVPGNVLRHRLPVYNRVLTAKPANDL
jgi:hypothetical protein